MPLKKLIDILGSMPVKSQKQIMRVVDFENDKPSVVLHKVIDIAMTLCKSSHREILAYMKTVPIDDNLVIQAFGNGGQASKPMTFNKEQFAYIKERIYRNRDGEFRLIPSRKDVSPEEIPIDGLKADEQIIQSRLTTTRVLSNGSTDEWNGLKYLKELPYEPPYAEPFDTLSANLQRINVVSSFDRAKPYGFFERNGMMYRNIACPMANVDHGYVSRDGLERAMLLIYLVSGATIDDMKALYNVIHFMVRVPNSATGYVLYLNDFDAGGNGKSKLVQVLQGMFGDSFSSFATQQLRFTMSLIGKRLVSISEFEETSSQKELVGIIKSMTGRDKFQYEGKGVDPIIADSYQNFVISSNRYITFEDGGINRRLQNFNCSNLLNVLLTQYFKSYSFLDDFFGNQYNGESREILKSMSNSLLDYILRDDSFSEIRIREQPIVLGNIKNPILRTMFASNVRISDYIVEDETTGGSRIDLWRMCNDPKPSELGYSAERIQKWLYDIRFDTSRDATTMCCSLNERALEKTIAERLRSLDETSRKLKDKYHVSLELGRFRDFDIELLLKKYLGRGIDKAPTEKIGNLLNVGR